MAARSIDEASDRLLNVRSIEIPEATTVLEEANEFAHQGIFPPDAPLLQQKVAAIVCNEGFSFFERFPLVELRYESSIKRYASDSLKRAPRTLLQRRARPRCQSVTQRLEFWG
jgi:hypothetical protein